jgi:hypothetical protein
MPCCAVTRCACAEGAAYAAAQEAAAHCSSAAIPGTSSSLLAPAAAVVQAAQQQLQHIGQQQRQQQERWSAQIQGSRGSWHSSNNGSSSGGTGELERAVLAAFKGCELHRRLASFRLHRCVSARKPSIPPSHLPLAASSVCPSRFQGHGVVQSW